MDVRVEPWRKLSTEKLMLFKLWCWKRLLKVPWTARKSNQSILKEISPEYSLEGLMLKLKLKYFGHLIDPDAGKDWRQEEKGTTENEMVGWHHRLNGHKFEQALEVGDGQGNLACCSAWGHKKSDTTEPLNWCICSIVISGVMLQAFNCRYQGISGTRRCMLLQYKKPQ